MTVMNPVPLAIAEENIPNAGKAARRRPVRGSRPGWFVYTSLVIVLGAALFPFYWSFLIGSHTKEVITRDVPPLLPGGHFLSNAQRVFDSVPFWKALGNSLMVSSVAATSITESVIVSKSSTSSPSDPMGSCAWASNPALMSTSWGLILSADSKRAR